MRIRTVKPEFWSNEKLSDVSESAHMFAAALLNYCDDEGFFNANQKLIKAALYPIRDPSVSIHGMITELSNIGYLRIGKGVDGRTYGHIIGFTEHQRINRPSSSKIKHLADFTDQSVSAQCVTTDNSLAEQGSGNREQGSRDQYITRSVFSTEFEKQVFDSLQPHFGERLSILNSNTYQRLVANLCRENYPGVDIPEQIRKAAVWEDSNPTRKKTGRGLPKFLTGWMDRAQNRSGFNGAQPNSPSTIKEM